MNFKKLKIYLIFLAIGNFITPIQAPTEKIESHHIITAYGALAGAYIGYKTCNQLYTSCTKTSVQEKYPYAQAWYENMAEKYPKTLLGNIKFVCSAPWMDQNFMAFQSIFQTIYCPEKTLQLINDLYKKQDTFNDIDQEDDSTLKIAEFLLVREAYHCQQKSTVILPLKFFTISSASTAGIELIARLCNISFNYHNFVHGMLALNASCLIESLLEDNELKADAYAYDANCDNNIIQGALAYLLDDQFNTIFNTYPNKMKRIELLTTSYKNLVMKSLENQLEY